MLLAGSADWVDTLAARCGSRTGSSDCGHCNTTKAEGPAAAAAAVVTDATTAAAAAAADGATTAAAAAEAEADLPARPRSCSSLRLLSGMEAMMTQRPPAARTCGMEGSDGKHGLNGKPSSDAVRGQFAGCTETRPAPLAAHTCLARIHAAHALEPQPLQQDEALERRLQLLQLGVAAAWRGQLLLRVFKAASRLLERRRSGKLQTVAQPAAASQKKRRGMEAGGMSRCQRAFPCNVLPTRHGTAASHSALVLAASPHIRASVQKQQQG